MPKDQFFENNKKIMARASNESPCFYEGGNNNINKNTDDQAKVLENN